MAIIVEVTEWLLSKGMRQWLRRSRAKSTRSGRNSGENYGLLVDGELAAVVSLIDFRPDYWAEYLPEDAVQMAGDAGVLARIQRAEARRTGDERSRAISRRRGLPAIYLDCVYGQGVLPEFYAALGYDQVARKELDFPAGTFDSVLMRKSAELAELGELASALASALASGVASSRGFLGRQHDSPSGRCSLARSQGTTRSKSVWKRKS